MVGRRRVVLAEGTGLVFVFDLEASGIHGVVEELVCQTERIVRYTLSRELIRLLLAIISENVPQPSKDQTKSNEAKSYCLHGTLGMQFFRAAIH